MFYLRYKGKELVKASDDSVFVDAFFRLLAKSNNVNIRLFHKGFDAYMVVSSINSIAQSLSDADKFSRQS